MRASGKDPGCGEKLTVKPRFTVDVALLIYGGSAAALGLQLAGESSDLLPL